MSKRLGFITLLFVLAGALFGGLFGNLPKNSASNEVTSEKIDADYSEALDVINSSYAGSIDNEKITESSVQGMLWSLDPHSSFFTRDEFKKLYEDQSSRFYGIGVSILQHKDGVYVQSVVPGTPAEKVGLRYGDRIIEINGKDATKWTSSEVSKNVRGERGTPVSVKLERASEDRPIDVEIVRDAVPFPSIRNYFMLKDDIGYIGLTGGFQETTSEELDQAISDLKKQGMRQVILDLRGNPGGLLPQAIGVASKFIEQGKVVVSVKGRSRFAKTEEHRATGNAIEDMPLVVMINGGSASASEIVAGAIQDYGRGMIVGSESFGKGLVQRMFYLPSGTGLTLTTARYYTPFGRSLQRDYSNGSIYEYYTHSNSSANANTTSETPESTPQPTPMGSPVTTVGGRIFYGGMGIDPDLKASPLPFNNRRFRINEAAFFFTRQLVAGKIPGEEAYKIDKIRPEQGFKTDSVQISEKLYSAFLAFLEKDKELGLTAENLQGQTDYVKNRLREELATANYSGEIGQEILLGADPQVLKAIEALPDARKLAENSKNNSNIG